MLPVDCLISRPGPCYGIKCDGAPLAQKMHKRCRGQRALKVMTDKKEEILARTGQSLGTVEADEFIDGRQVRRFTQRCTRKASASQGLDCEVPATRFGMNRHWMHVIEPPIFCMTALAWPAWRAPAPSTAAEQAKGQEARKQRKGHLGHYHVQCGGGKASLASKRAEARKFLGN